MVLSSCVYCSAFPYQVLSPGASGFHSGIRYSAVKMQQLSSPVGSPFHFLICVIFMFLVSPIAVPILSPEDVPIHNNSYVNMTLET